jgi:DNA modification methylase
MTDLRIETVNINSLTPDPANARKHDGKNLQAIENSLLKFGQRKPICVTPDSIVVAGNGTLEAAKNLGWTEIVIARTPVGWSWEQIRAFALADNRTAELAEWDDKVLADQLLELDANGWELEDLGFENLEPTVNDEDDQPLSFDDAPTRAKLGDHWVIGNHHLICGDSSDKNVIQKFGVLFDAIITDPPYGISIVKNNKVGGPNLAKNGTYKEVIGDESGDIAAITFNVIKDLYPNSIQVWWGANHYARKASVSDSSCWLVWNKNNGQNNFADCELAWTNSTSAVRMFTHTWNGMIRESERDKRVHPTQKPIALTEWIISTLKIHKGSNVLDLFGGSGSTLLGADKAGCNGFGIELDPYYVDVILSRLEKQTGLEAQLIED